MSGEEKERKISRRDFLKLAAAAGISVAAAATGLGPSLEKMRQNLPPAPAYAEGKYGAIGSRIDLKIGYLPFASDIITANLVKQRRLLEKYLPPGSSVTWLRFLGGVLVTNNMLADKVQIGYMGDMPSYRCLDILDSKV